MSYGAILNSVRREAEGVVAQRPMAHVGIVTSYDPLAASVKVELQPGGQETGWIPVGTVWIGPNFGFFCGPAVGDMVDVHFQEGSKGAGFVTARFHSSVNPAMGVPSGEAWLVHSSGSNLKFLNDGSVQLHAATALNSSAPTWTHTGDVRIEGDVVVTQDIWDRDTTENSIHHFREFFNAHEHTGVVAGGDLSGVPNELL